MTQFEVLCFKTHLKGRT